jgi:hypothetical protein
MKKPKVHPGNVGTLLTARLLNVMEAAEAERDFLRILTLVGDRMLKSKRDGALPKARNGL